MALRVSVVVAGGHGQGRYRLALQTGKRMSFEAFLVDCERATSLTKADTLAALTCVCEWIVRCAAQGRECDLGPLGRTRLGMTGSFEQYPDVLLDRDVSLRLSLQPSRSIQRRVREAGRKAVRTRVAKHSEEPSIAQVRLFDTTRNCWILDGWDAGSTLEVEGSGLRFDRNDPTQGLFVRQIHHDVWTRLKSYQDIEPSRLRAVTLESSRKQSPWQLEIRTRSNDSNRSLRRHRYARSLE